MEMIKTKSTKSKVKVTTKGYCHQVKGDQVKQKLQNFKYNSRTSPESIEVIETTKAVAGDEPARDDTGWEMDRESVDLEAAITNNGAEWANQVIGDKAALWADIVQRDQNLVAALSGGGASAKAPTSVSASASTSGCVLNETQCTQTQSKPT